jgi:hypothetical protein
MGDLAELGLNRPVQDRMTVAMEVDPNGRGSVEIPLPVNVDQRGTATLFDDDGLFLLPLLLLGEGMPEVPMVPFT